MLFDHEEHELPGGLQAVGASPQSLQPVVCPMISGRVFDTALHWFVCLRIEIGWTMPGVAGFFFAEAYCLAADSICL